MNGHDGRPDPSGRLHVGVNLLWLVPGVVGGSEEYTTRLLQALRDAEPPDLRLTLFALASFVEAHPDVADAFRTEVLDLDGRSKPRRVAAEVTWLGLQARRSHVDLLHHAGGVVPPGPALSRIPAVLTIHDLQPLLHPANFSRLKRRWLASMVPRSAARARMVLTPSDPASRSVIEHLGIAEERVQTVPHGIEAPPVLSNGERAAVRRRYGIDGPMILYPAITYPHKDHATLIEAFARIATDRPDLTLVLTGGAGPSEVEVAAAIRRSGRGSQVRRTGRVPWSDLHGLYAAATAVAVPSRFEGFGAPALEAMAAGAPLVAADATALPWVVGDGGLLVEPGDRSRWADTLAKVIDDPGEQARLSRLGRARAAAFSWSRAAAALAEGYRSERGADSGGDHPGG